MSPKNKNKNPFLFVRSFHLNIIILCQKYLESERYVLPTSSPKMGQLFLNNLLYWGVTCSVPAIQCYSKFTRRQFHLVSKL